MPPIDLHALPPLPTLTLHEEVPLLAVAAATHQLWLLPRDGLPADLPERPFWLALLRRQGRKVSSLAESPIVADLPGGQRAACLVLPAGGSRFAWQGLIAKAMSALLEEHPKRLAFVVWPGFEDAGQVAEAAAYTALCQAARQPVWQSKKPARPLVQVDGFGAGPAAAALGQRASIMARENARARWLTAQPGNVLTPARFRKEAERLSGDAGWQCEVFDLKALEKLKAGCFLAVAQGSPEKDAAIVRLGYRPKGARRRLALVGKGICFDTGGHNLKPARYMHHMHEDMAGAAVVLSLMTAIAEAKLPVVVDCWLALSRNDISPAAMRQNDVIKAGNGQTVEIVHTDAEGRLVLADTLWLAGQQKPDLVIDFATLTGSMVRALGCRYSGAFASDDRLARLAEGAGRRSGERVCVFPMDEDYDAPLDSKVADIKQCTMDSDADHILAARFLSRFAGKQPWLHIDLSAARCEGGLGAVPGDVTGFGVAWGLQLVEDWLLADE